MTADPFASGPVSLVLAWLLSISGLWSLVRVGVPFLFNQFEERIPTWFLVWLTIALLILSPISYITLMIIVGLAYPAQSFGAFMTLFFLAWYVPIVFGTLCFAGLVLPILLTLRIAFHNLREPLVSRGRLILGALLAPANMIGGHLLFFWLLTYAGKTVHWLSADNLIGATNGPALFVYEHALKYVIRLPVSESLQDVTASDREMLRNHVATFYLGRRAQAKYVMLTYPGLYERLPNRHE